MKNIFRLSLFTGVSCCFCDFVAILFTGITKLLFFGTKDRTISIPVKVASKTVWLSLDQMASLFQRDKSTVSRFINNIFIEGELVREAVVAKYATTAVDGKTYQVDYFNLDVIISVGYRVNHRKALSSDNGQTG